MPSGAPEDGSPPAEKQSSGPPGGGAGEGGTKAGPGVGPADHASEPGAESGAGWQSDAPERRAPAAEPVEPSATTLASVADKVQGILEAAEATAAAIRREAEADAARAADERERRRRARDELTHLSRLADGLSVQAEAVSRQCDVVARVLEPSEAAEPDAAGAAGREVAEPDAAEAAGREAGGREPAEPDAAEAAGREATARGVAAREAAGRDAGGREAAVADAAAGSAAWAGEDAAAAQARAAGEEGSPSRDVTAGDEGSPSRDVTAGEEAPAGEEASTGPSEAPPPGSGRTVTSEQATDPAGARSAGGSRLPPEWLEAYRMRLAGAARDEIEGHLRRAGVEDPARLADEIFRDEPERG